VRPDLITFDCYGTLIDWREGIRRAVRRHIPESAGTRDDDLFGAFAEIENEIEAGAYHPYRAVLRETARRLAARFGWRLSATDEGFLAESLPSWTPFADVNPALERLRSTGYRLGILSNIDDDLLAGTLRHFTVSFDLVVTAQQVKSYKPAPAHFLRARDAVGGDPRRLLHMAQSDYHDVQAAAPLGIPVVWVNRSGDSRRGKFEPVAEVADVGRAVAWLESVPG
jgi:2-haloalkanoic acid dehalogenase type II